VNYYFSGYSQYFSVTDAAYTINIPWDRARKTTWASSFFCV